MTTGTSRTEHSATIALDRGPSRPDRTRRRIIVAAVELFEQRGYDATTVDDIAAHAGVSVRSVHRHFASKAHIIIEDRSDDFDRFLWALAKQPREVTDTEALLATIAASLSDDHELDGRRVRLLLDNPPIYAAFTARLRTLERGLADWLAERSDRAPDDLEVRARAAALVAAHRTLLDVTASEGSANFLQRAHTIFGALGGIPSATTDPT